MSGFFASMFDELAARRRRMRAVLGERGQALAEFFVFAALMLGSIGLFVREWMPAAAPWGFWLPFIFLAGFFAIELRRQRAFANVEAPESLVRTYDWTALGWSFACALLGIAAFVIAYSSEPKLEEWTPPDSAIAVDIAP